MQNYRVMPKKGDWQVKMPGHSKASGIYETQKEAELAAKDWARKAGGGEVTICRPDGTVRDSDTIPRANDSFPPRDKKH